jgi:hypothetical protein
MPLNGMTRQSAERSPAGRHIAFSPSASSVFRHLTFYSQQLNIRPWHSGIQPAKMSAAGGASFNE